MVNTFQIYDSLNMAYLVASLCRDHNISNEEILTSVHKSMGCTGLGEQVTTQWALFGGRSMKKCPGNPKEGEKDSN